MVQILAFAYGAFIVGVIGFQLALIAGAPWGRLTQGGTHSGALPTSGRLAAGASIVVLAALGLAILSQVGSGPDWPRWTGWVAAGVQALVFAANCATRSAPERKLWAPITGVMLALALSVMVLACCRGERQVLLRFDPDGTLALAGLSEREPEIDLLDTPAFPI
ncbi:hypothetical protein [Bauldia litoralis]|uniref:Uncharacterized protein n=1 Tax=Bauldia litoralis TaxID=665467 RepID=A0A1G6B9M6_9HYPH|nr:hypothetical protein [Bauldia litoralis]SDB17325.1 hypothetical protein SAMN02982931_01394 [Bauldia litoralis]